MALRLVSSNYLGALATLDGNGATVTAITSACPHSAVNFALDDLPGGAESSFATRDTSSEFVWDAPVLELADDITMDLDGEDDHAGWIVADTTTGNIVALLRFTDAGVAVTVSGTSASLFPATGGVARATDGSTLTDRLVPAGGTTGQALVKASGSDYDSEWGTISGGGGPVTSDDVTVPGGTIYSVASDIDATTAFASFGAILLDTSAASTGDVLSVGTPGSPPSYEAPTGGGGSGDVVGPASVTDGNLAAFDTTTGKLIKQLTPSQVRTLLALVPGTDIPAGAASPWLDFMEILCAVRPPNIISGSGATYTRTSSTILGGGYGATNSAATFSGTWSRLPLRAGTWACEPVVRKASAGGIATMAIAGTTSTFDTYNSGSLGDQIGTPFAFTVSADGFYDFVLTNPTKNASASAYTLTPQFFRFYRTGA